MPSDPFLFLPAEGEHGGAGRGAARWVGRVFSFGTHPSGTLWVSSPAEGEERVWAPGKGD